MVKSIEWIFVAIDIAGFGLDHEGPNQVWFRSMTTQIEALWDYFTMVKTVFMGGPRIQVIKCLVQPF